MNSDGNLTQDAQQIGNETTQHIATFCHASSNVCPKAYINSNAPKEKTVEVVDDFGNKIFMSREQYTAMVTHGDAETPV